jgi:hypothetical protein
MAQKVASRSPGYLPERTRDGRSQRPKRAIGKEYVQGDRQPGGGGSPRATQHDHCHRASAGHRKPPTENPEAPEKRITHNAHQSSPQAKRVRAVGKGKSKTLAREVPGEVKQGGPGRAFNWPVLRCPRLAGFGVSPEGKPFWARFEETQTWRTNSRTITEMITGWRARSSDGATRKEANLGSIGGRPLWLASITEPGTSVVNFVNGITRSCASGLDGEKEMSQCLNWKQSTDSLSAEMDAERRLIDHLLCRRLLLHSDERQESVGYAWIAEELVEVIQEEVITPQSRYSWRLFDIRREEPTPGLFDIPPNFLSSCAASFPSGSR